MRSCFDSFTESAYQEYGFCLSAPNSLMSTPFLNFGEKFKDAPVNNLFERASQFIERNASHETAASLLSGGSH